MGPGGLSGRRVLITRPREQAGSLAAAVHALGGIPVLCPLIRYAPPDDPEALNHALAGRFDWVVFTSRQAVTAFLAGPARQGDQEEPRAWPRETGECPREAGEWPGEARVAAVGEATARALWEAGVRVDLIPPRADGAHLAAALTGTADPPGAVRAGTRVLLPRSQIARPELPRLLREAGCDVTEVTVYRTLPVSHLPAGVHADLVSCRLDAVTFFSPSAVRVFHDLAVIDPGLARVLSGPGRPTVACIGPTTAAEAKGLTLPVDVVADRYDAQGLAEALALYWEGRLRG